MRKSRKIEDGLTNQQRHAKHHPGVGRYYTIKCKYGLTQEQYEERLQAQAGVCAICHEPEKLKHGGVVKPLCVDHDHATGKVRQLLCNRCNILVAQLENNVLLIEAARAYLKKHNQLGG